MGGVRGIGKGAKKRRTAIASFCLSGRERRVNEGLRMFLFFFEVGAMKNGEAKYVRLGSFRARRR